VRRGAGGGAGEAVDDAMCWERPGLSFPYCLLTVRLYALAASSSLTLATHTQTVCSYSDFLLVLRVRWYTRAACSSPACPLVP